MAFNLIWVGSNASPFAPLSSLCPSPFLVSSACLFPPPPPRSAPVSQMYSSVGKMKEAYDGLTRLNLAPQTIGHEFDFAQLPQALALMQSGQSVGKIVVNVSQS
jgi:hypothetical protein